MKKELSVIIPVFNEEKAIFVFHKRLSEALDKTGIGCEIIYINDGSTDNSLYLLKDLLKNDHRISIIDFSRNFGKENAMTAGLQKSSGKAMIIIDCDLQDPPELINEMVAKWIEGYDVILMKRIRRHGESFLKKITAKTFYKILQRLSNIDLPENVGDFRLMSRKVIEAIKDCPEKVRFMKGLFAWQGFRTAVIEYEREQRVGGKSAFSYWKLWDFALDGLTSFSTAPLKLPTWLGIFLVMTALAYAIAQFLFLPVPSPNATLLLCVLALSGVQMLMLGIIGEYVARISIETKRRPLYIIDRIYTSENVDE